ncbi:hypothetical protein [Ferrimonas sp. SCSIO 43195]|uniref:hypothetical protein n=1 Tax=Ferrimonas sp. SCSIO 43195 TaxID=2822844 RepID=UPI00207554B5|nr:hypothetical protein [Ferrimonas sp. SCSIO 43195]USD38063.1 hypothetical protein J8Z22_02545 [Ferrimonas sp. SCSIO 43195]
MRETLTALMVEQGELTHQLNLTNGQHLAKLTAMAELLLDSGMDLFQLKAMEQELILHQALAAKMAVKLAISKLCLQKCRPNTLISVVFAMYKEHQRMLSPMEHPHGEDFIRRKSEQLQWLCKDLPNVDWRMILVDDGCPERSGQCAQKQVEELEQGHKIEVRFLSRAIAAKEGPAASLTSTADSQKGGSIAYGMWHAARTGPTKNHFIAYTDADLSTHLGQLGLLVDNLSHHDNIIACGSRREPTSVVVKQGMRNHRGKLFIYLWKRLLPQLHNIIDTQCGFKMFRSEFVTPLTREMMETKFAFDMELLLKSQLLSPHRIGKVAVGWIDSDALSTTSELSPYLPMLKSIVKMYRFYVPAQPISDEFASLIESMNESQWNTLVEAMAEVVDDADIEAICRQELFSPLKLAREAGVPA